MPDDALIILDGSINVQNIRKVWYNDEWYFCAIDLIGVLLDHNNFKAGHYWRTLKLRLGRENHEIIPHLVQLKVLAADQKMRFTDMADAKTCIEIQKVVERISFNRTKRIRRHHDEILDVHPIVTSILEREGWTIDHHVDLPSGKILDLLAERSKTFMIVECKTSLRDSRIFRAVGQVLCYVVEHGGNAIPAIACFADGIDDYSYHMCKMMNIRLIALNR